MLFTNGIDLSYHDRTISQLKNSGGFGLIKDQTISDAILDYGVFMRESIEYGESSRSTHLINNEILHNQSMYEVYRVEHLKDSAIRHRNDMKNDHRSLS